MKQILFMLALLAGAATSHAQYDREKLVNLLTSGTTKTWTVKGVSTERPEKSFTFNKDMSVDIVKNTGKGLGEPQKDKWTLTSKDNIRWFVSIGNASYELIVSYAKDGSQYMKLVYQTGGNKMLGTYEMNLLPAK